MDEVSYDFAMGNRKPSAKGAKRDAINRMRKLRKIGINELPPPYPNGWYSILESSSLKPGKATSVSCLGETFAVYRTAEGKVNVLDAYCPHLGANLGVGGRVEGDNIVCPFHQWSFRGTDGQCTNVPYSNCGKYVTVYSVFYYYLYFICSSLNIKGTQMDIQGSK